MSNINLYSNEWTQRKLIRARAAKEVERCCTAVGANFIYSSTDVEARIRKYEHTYDFETHGTKIVYLTAMVLNDVYWVACLHYINEQKNEQAQYDCVIEEWMATLENEIVKIYCVLSVSSSSPASSTYHGSSISSSSSSSYAP